MCLILQQRPFLIRTACSAKTERLGLWVSLPHYYGIRVCSGIISIFPFSGFFNGDHGLEGLGRPMAKEADERPEFLLRLCAPHFDIYSLCMEFLTSESSFEPLPRSEIVSRNIKESNQ